MKRVISLISFTALVLLICACLVVPAAAESLKGASISGKVAFSTGQAVPDGTIVRLVNGSNSSDYIPGFNATPDANGFFQFTNITQGFYRVYAWSPYYVEGYSEGVNVISNDTYTRSVVLIAMPYYANMTASTYHVTYGNSADITVQVNDYWGHSVGAGWQILLRTTVGILTPDSAFTDNNGRVYSNLPWEDNSTPAEVTAFAIASNGSSYGLLENMTVVTTPPSATLSPPANATVTPTPTAVPNATVTATPTAIPSATAATPMPSPGFVLIGALVALGLVLAFKRYQ